MKKLEYTVNCLDGVYTIVCEFDDVVDYVIETNIESLSSKQGQLNEELNKVFIDNIDKANIKSWDLQYNPTDSTIEDAIDWQIVYFDNDKEYKSCGTESYQPYNYEYIVEAILLCDEDSAYLF